MPDGVRCCWPGQVWEEAKRSCIGTPTECPLGSKPAGQKCRYPVRTGEHGLRWVFSPYAGVEFTESAITTDQYLQCARAGKCRHPDKSPFCNYGQINRSTHPVNGVDFQQATSFCRWVGGRLPSAEEWEQEASAGDVRTYPWGEEQPSCDHGVRRTNERLCEAEYTQPVCRNRKGDSVSGLCDMQANVSEWTSTVVDGEAILKGSLVGNRRSKWERDRRLEPNRKEASLGFRCARIPSE